MRGHPLQCLTGLFTLSPKYGSSLLEGQREILTKLADILFPKLEEGDPQYFPVLTRMPTGTGKTGVIAIAAYLANYRGSTLILTPWKNLCDQMKDDLEGVFWQTLGLTDSVRIARRSLED